MPTNVLRLMQGRLRQRIKLSFFALRHCHYLFLCQSRCLYNLVLMHVLIQLVICHAFEEPVVCNMKSTVQELRFCFNNSAKQLMQYQEALTNDAENHAAMKLQTKLQSLWETMWAARANALLTFRNSFSTVVDALNDLHTNYWDIKTGAFKLARSISQFGLMASFVSLCFCQCLW